MDVGVSQSIKRAEQILCIRGMTLTMEIRLARLILVRPGMGGKSRLANFHCSNLHLNFPEQHPGVI